MDANFKSDGIKLIIGLGNPDKDYTNTYHNAGFLFVDRLKTAALFHKPAQILKSNAYMNESGNFVRKEIKKRNIAPPALLVVHDDSDITIGIYKLSFDRGAAGHKGVESIVKTLKTKKIWRLRIGIRPKVGFTRVPPAKPLTTHGRNPNEALLRARLRRVKAGEFVLKQISSGDKKELEAIFEEATQVLLL